jgi:hypothetical protein
VRCTKNGYKPMLTARRISKLTTFSSRTLGSAKSQISEFLSAPTIHRLLRSQQCKVPSSGWPRRLSKPESKDTHLRSIYGASAVSFSRCGAVIVLGKIRSPLQSCSRSVALYRYCASSLSKLQLYSAESCPPVPDEIQLSPLAEDFRLKCFAMYVSHFRDRPCCLPENPPANLKNGQQRLCCAITLTWSFRCSGPSTEISNHKPHDLLFHTQDFLRFHIHRIRCRALTLGEMGRPIFIWIHVSRTPASLVSVLIASSLRSPPSTLDVAHADRIGCLLVVFKPLAF